MNEPDQDHEDRPLCPDCGQPMRIGRAIGCGPRGAIDIALPPWCPSPDCRRTRDARAIEQAIAAGVITRG